jgi:hypothetical protein
MRLGTDLVIRHREVGRHDGVLARGARIQLFLGRKLAVWPNQAVQQRHSAAVHEFQLAYSITSSARASKVGGTVRPSTLAVF